MEKLKIGMYVRTKNGIGKVDETEMFMGKYFQFHLDSNKGRIYNVTTNTYWNSVEDIIGEPSTDIIEVIQPGDYVNGKFVFVAGYNRYDDWCVTVLEFDDCQSYRDYIYVCDIETIVTREQFNAMRYMVKGE